MNKKELIKEFIETKTCQLCGTQRCDASEEWIEGCQEFKNFVKNVERTKISVGKVI